MMATNEERIKDLRCFLHSIYGSGKYNFDDFTDDDLLGFASELLIDLYEETYAKDFFGADLQSLVDRHVYVEYRCD